MVCPVLPPFPPFPFPQFESILINSVYDGFYIEREQGFCYRKISVLD